MATDQARLTKLLRARHPCIAIHAVDEAYLMEALVAAAADLGRSALTWNSSAGIASALFQELVETRPDTNSAVKALARMREEHGQHTLFILSDLGDHLDDAPVLRAARELIAHCRRVRATVVLVDHRDALPPAIEREAVRITAAMPGEVELLAAARLVIDRLDHENPGIAARFSRAELEGMARQLRGLTRSQAERVVADLAVDDEARAVGDGAWIQARKRELLKGSGLLEEIPIAVTLEEVAGIDLLAAWLMRRRAALEGEIPGVPSPRGVLLLGVPGTGKSMCAKAIATAWGRPLMRLDAGVLYDQYVGASEARLREALRQAEALAPVVLWVDEIEKAFASAASQSTDGGLSQRMFGHLLTWMQERAAPVFTVATANDIEALPPELLRKGRFDEIFFLDLPTTAVRRDLLRIHLGKRGQDPAAFDLDALARASERFAGADIEQCVIAALLEAHLARRALDTAAVLVAIRATTPLAITMDERVTHLRAWAAARCRPAGSPEGRASTA